MFIIFSVVICKGIYTLIMSVGCQHISVVLIHFRSIGKYDIRSILNLIHFPLQTTSKRLADRKSAKFQKNITKRGLVPETTVKKGNDYPVGPMVLGFFIFVVIGSCKLQACLAFAILPSV